MEQKLDDSVRLRSLAAIQEMGVGESIRLKIPLDRLNAIRTAVRRLMGNGFSFKVLEGDWVKVTRRADKPLQAQVLELLDARVPVVEFERVANSPIPAYVSRYNIKEGTAYRCEELGDKLIVRRDTATEAWLPLRDALNSPTGTAEDIDKALARLVAYCQQEKARRT